jgi:glycosyltransferase involved in cell wall biosynthesis
MINPFHYEYQLNVDTVFKGTYNHYCSSLSPDKDLSVVTTALYKVKKSPIWLLYPVKITRISQQNGPSQDTLPLTPIMNLGMTVPYDSGRMYSVVNYYSSACIGMALLYQGKRGNGQIDVIRGDDTTFCSMVFPIIKEVINPLRKDLGMALAPCINTWHNLCRVGDTDRASSEERQEKLRGLGLGRDEVRDSGHLMAAYSDMTVFIGAGQKSDFFHLHPKVNMGMRQVYQEEGALDKTCLIQNCITPECYDLRSEIAFGKGTWERFGADYGLWRRNVTKMLFDKKKLASETRWPIVTYTGRFGEEKGVGELAMAAEIVHDLGGQMVIIGTGHHPEINRWQTLQQGKLKDSLTLILNLEAQEELIEGVSRGLWTRGAACVAIQPSHLEACGLAPMEDLSMGKLVIGTNAQGLKNVLEPFDLANPNSSRAAVRYTHLERDESQLEMRKVIQASFEMIWKRLKEMESQGYHQAALGITEQAIKSFSWINIGPDSITGNMMEYVKLYYKMIGGGQEQGIIPLIEIQKRILGRRHAKPKYVIESARATKSNKERPVEPPKKQVELRVKPAPSEKEPVDNQYLSGLAKGFLERPAKVYAKKVDAEETKPIEVIESEKIPEGVKRDDSQEEGVNYQHIVAQLAYLIQEMVRKNVTADITKELVKIGLRDEVISRVVKTKEKLEQAHLSDQLALLIQQKVKSEMATCIAKELVKIGLRDEMIAQVVGMNL